MRIDLDKMSKEELQSLQKDVEKALKTIDARRRAEAKRAAEEAARQFGFSLDDLAGGSGAAKGGKNPPRYANPDDRSKTWTGRGRQPGWVKSHLERGGKLEDLAI